MITSHNRTPANINMPVTKMSRPPLGDATNSPPPSPPATRKGNGQIVRRKSTQQVLNHNLDSSESFPSAHSSLYEASLQDEKQQETLYPGTSDWETNPSIPTTEEPSSWADTVIGPDGSPVPFSFLTPISHTIKKHTPHKLYPITEQNSLATLRTRTSSTRSLRARSPGLN
ncbi:MAG: hypothetical protein Q9164_004590, partial [Protoblastenia rupestris]